MLAAHPAGRFRRNRGASPFMREGEEGGGTIPLDESWLASLPVSPAGRTAIDLMLEDQRQLRAHGLSPILDCIHGYPRDDDAGPVPTDVFSFHVDSAPTETDTWLCTYFGGAPSEGLLKRTGPAPHRHPGNPRRAPQSLRRRRRRRFLSNTPQENCYDLHYAPLTQAQPYTFGIGNSPGASLSNTPAAQCQPCIHRAPKNAGGRPPAPPPDQLKRPRSSWAVSHS